MVNPALKSEYLLEDWRLFRLICVVTILALLAALPCRAQTTSSQGHSTMIRQPIGQPVGDYGSLTGAPPEQNWRLLRALNSDRQKAMVSDANKLLRLVNELNAEIAQTNPGSLSPDQLRKVAQIEKLAHDVKDKMCTSVRGTPAFQSPFQPVHN
ncbi:MAG: hypothetical protein ABR987_09240 [Terracidiphilus sp.]|jgi:hypothetical protein